MEALLQEIERFLDNALAEHERARATLAGFRQRYYTLMASSTNPVVGSANDMPGPRPFELTDEGLRRLEQFDRSRSPFVADNQFLGSAPSSRIQSKKNATRTNIDLTSNEQKREKLWVIFCVHDDTEAYLEAYIDNKLAVLHKPDWMVYLNDIQHISPTICPNEEEYEFVLTLKNDVVRMLAPSWDQMLDWVTCLQHKLQELNILNPKDNHYTKSPEFRSPALLSTRDPTSPLPPPPVPATRQNELISGVEALHLVEEGGTSSANNTPGPSRRWNRSISENGATSQQLTEDIFNFDNLPSSGSAESNCHYDRIFELQNDPGTSTRHLERFPSSLQQPPHQVSYKTFREQQVLELQKEMKHSGGVKFKLRKKDCLSSIAFVDAFDSVWVCGWKHKDNPYLYNALHIGDKVLSIAGVRVKSASDIHHILQSNYCGLFVDFVIKRLPHGQIHLFHRETEGQPLGIVQENNTAVIETVEADSLAARQGLSIRARTCDGLTLTNWVLTEVNGRPLNLFFKKDQVKDRLNCVGRDISILVQPLDLIKQLKKELKSLRNYKDFLLQ